MKLRCMDDLDMDGRSVFMRLDLNVPLQDGVVVNDARLRAAIPTIQLALKKGARLALASHLGRPKGRRDAAFSLDPVGLRLSELLNLEVLLADNCIGDGVRGLMRDNHAGSMVLLENLRFHPGETGNDPDFARQLVSSFDLYINDAFGACHRSHASIVGVLPYVEGSAAGPLIEHEVSALERLRGEDIPRPFVALVGGAKVSDKIGILNAMLSRVDVICIGGAMAYSFLKAKGIGVGASRVEEGKVRMAAEILHRAKHRGVEVILPVDHIAAAEFRGDAQRKLLTAIEIDEGLMGLDIGVKTRELFAEQISRASSLLWNGPMGVFEWDAFSEGTRAVAQAVADCSGYTVVGGGDSLAALELVGLSDCVDHVSTGGGASLDFVERGMLPGLNVLTD